MNRNSFLLFFILYGLVLSAMIVRDGDLMLLALPLLVYLILGLLQAPSEIKLIADRTISKSSSTPQETNETRISIQNHGNSLINLDLDDPLETSVNLHQGQAHLRTALKAGQNTELSYQFQAARGVYRWESLHATASDPFGLFTLKADIPASGELLVRPQPMLFRQTNLKPRFTLHSAGPIPARLAGPGTDFWGIREYRTGDTLRRLNWRLAARHPRKLFTNEYEREEIADFGLILDTRQFTPSIAMEEALFEYSVRAAMTFSENILKNGHRVSLLVFGKSIISVFPGYGKKQINSLRRKLARARLDSYVPFNYLEYFPTRLFPARSVIVIFSSLDTRDLDVYARLRATGYEVVLISPDPVDFASRNLPVSETNARAIRLARVARVIDLERLLKLGVKVIDWQVETPLDTIVRQSVRQFAQRRNL